MTAKKHLAPTIAPDLTTLPWMTKVIAQLASARSPAAGLIGVDIGHVNMPSAGQMASEPCVAFVSRADGIKAVCGAFTDAERLKADLIHQVVITRSREIARATHEALCATCPQLNTLVFRDFTLAYSFNDRHPGSERETSIQARLILHDREKRQDPHILNRSVQNCLDCFTAAHDDLCCVKLVAPTPGDLR